VCLSVSFSVRPSHAGIVSKRLNVESRKTTPHDSPGISSFLMPKILMKFQRGYPPRGRQIKVGVG